MMCELVVTAGTGYRCLGQDDVCTLAKTGEAATRPSIRRVDEGAPSSFESGRHSRYRMCSHGKSQLEIANDHVVLSTHLVKVERIEQHVTFPRTKELGDSIRNTRSGIHRKLLAVERAVGEGVVQRQEVCTVIGMAMRQDHRVEIIR